MVERKIKELTLKENIDFIIANGENSANGKGLRKVEYDRLIKAKVDAITMGNHIYYRKEMATMYKELPRLIIPSNITNLEDKEYILVEKNEKKIAIMNLIGRVNIGEVKEENSICPFDSAKKIIKKLKELNVDYIFLDFHAEATAEKIAMGYYLKDDVTCVFGTHTHVQTADEKIIDGKMAYITDVGMTGPSDSVLGLKKEIAIRRFVTGEKIKYECSENSAIFNAIIVETDDTKNIATSIKRINL